MEYYLISPLFWQNHFCTFYRLSTNIFSWHEKERKNREKSSYALEYLVEKYYPCDRLFPVTNIQNPILILLLKKLPLSAVTRIFFESGLVFLKSSI